jgi:hypothetical protein
VTGSDEPRDPFGRRAFFSQAPIGGVDARPPAGVGPEPAARKRATEGRRALFSVPEPAEVCDEPPQAGSSAQPVAAGPPESSGRAEKPGAPEPARPLGPAATPPRAEGGSVVGHAVVECRTCREHTTISVAALAVKLIPSIWLPTRPWPHLMRCPSCNRLSWCRVKWGLSLRP